MQGASKDVVFSLLTLAVVPDENRVLSHSLASSWGDLAGLLQKQVYRRVKKCGQTRYSAWACTL